MGVCLRNHGSPDQEGVPYQSEIQCFEVVPERLCAPCEQFRKRIKEIRKSMAISTNLIECKAVLFYVPIVSRAGTDIGAALQELDKYKDKHIALVVLHHTFDRELIVPDSSRNVRRDKTITVDCLFSEDEGLFKCHRNDEAIKKVADWLHKVKHGKQSSSGKKKERGRQKRQV
ncbi:hypothetical protein QTP86_026644 [Hemibagrus guttatus]|nr:hypothetical protein QTP86_026644 [Hemibagrus guttatus]